MKNTVVKAGILGAIAVLAGAFGAHALKEVLDAQQLGSFETGVRYQMIHAVVLLLLALIVDKYEIKQFVIASQLIFWGIVLFSGSIYLLTLKNIMEIAWLNFAVPITPIGGSLLILGWVYIVIGGIILTKNW